MIEAVRPFTIYGLRLKGSKEVRYVGQTAKSPEVRLASHLGTANSRRPCNRPLREWLAANQSEVEIFKIAYADTREEARAIEAAIIALCSRLQHRIFNQRWGDNRKAEKSEAA
jgi:hypothetical protein